MENIGELKYSIDLDASKLNSLNVTISESGELIIPTVDSKKVKFEDLNESVQLVASNFLAETLRERLDIARSDRTEVANGMAKTVRSAFESLFND